MKILSHLSLPGLEALLQARVPDARLIYVDPAQPPQAGLEGDALLTLGLGTPYLGELLEACPGIRWVHVYGTGVDGFPLSLVGNRTLTCSRGATAVPIAEWVMAMLLTAVKRLPQSWVHAPPAHWHMANLRSLAGQRLAIAGFGTIGQAVARRALAFDMSVRAWVRQPRVSEVPGVMLVQDWESLVEDADHVVLALPLTPATRGFLDAAHFAQLPEGVHLVNVARGPVLDQEALRGALEGGRVGLASLDVVDPEPLPDGHWLYTHPSVRLSPHVSWSSPEVLDVMRECFLDNARRWSESRSLQAVVDVAAGY